jgi:hypothetical protein
VNASRCNPGCGCRRAGRWLCKSERDTEDCDKPSAIESADYYVVIIADRYGSLADDGLSFTEKEYDYARSIGKPSLIFLHGDRGSIARAKTEQIAKVGRD